MKKIVFCVVLIAISVCFVACSSGGSTVDQSWANNETLVFSITDSNANNAEVGTMTFVTTTKLTDQDKQINGSADTKMTATVTMGNITRTTVYYAKIYTVLSLTSTYVDTDNAENDYVLNASHDGKKYVYDLEYSSAPSKNKNGELNVGSSGYSDGEFLYFYIRCHDVSAVPSSIKIADPFNDVVVDVTCTLSSNTVSVTTGSTLGTVVCNKIEVTRNDSPVGSGMSVCYLPEEKQYTYGDGSMIKSVCFPTKIVENNLTYTLKSFEVTK